MKSLSRNWVPPAYSSWIVLLLTFTATANSVSAQTQKLLTNTTTLEKPIGSACSTDSDCIKDAWCLYYKCECPEGSVPIFGGRECRRAVGQSCTQDDQCVTAATCTGSSCNCEYERNLVPTAGKTRCGIMAGSECDPGGVQCVEFAECLIDISSPKYFCKCVDNYSAILGLCNGSGILSPERFLVIVGFVGLFALAGVLK